MPAPTKVTILLADEDALRRDGLAAVLSGTENYEVVARVPDGPTALQEIRDRRPDVAVVDLNLSGIHAIELVRRIRSEALHTRVVILASTSDDEIIREVVRAGADGYLLKNGPARHLIDAISYVRDGGQYFSPQLHRDGRDRHLLQEPPRQYPDSPAPAAQPASRAPAPEPEEYEDEEEEPAERQPRPARSARPKSRMGLRRTAPPGQWRERMREEAGSPGLGDRDYEIMSMMADGIKPILDRLDEIDNRVALMEVGDAPVPTNPREWLSHELVDTLGRGSDNRMMSRTAGELEARLPEMIEQAVTNRFNQMAGKLQQEIEETHVKTLETFVKNIQVKLVQRVSALEQDMSKQADAMNELRQSSLRTEDNLSRLITGVDKLAQELPKRLANAAASVAAAENAPPPPSKSAFATTPPAAKKKAQASSKRTPKMVLIGLCVLLVLGLAVWGFTRLSGPRKAPPSGPDAVASSPGSASGAHPTQLTPPPPNADTKTKLQAAQNYVDSKDYPMAEDIYKQILNSEPKNVDALQGLATVLYREDKIDEAAAILDRIPK